MKENSKASKKSSGLKMSTRQIATAFNVKPQTPIAAICRQGHWLGMRPVKLPNGRWSWDAGDSECVQAGEEL